MGAVTRTVIVTGAGRGIGREIALQCSRDGFSVVGVDKSFSSTAELNSVVQGDVRSSDVIKLAFDQAISQGKPVALVNAAGVSHPETGDFKAETWDETISVNLTAVFTWCENFRRLLVAGTLTGTAVVNVGSLASHRAFSNNPSYLASKSGILGLTRAFALELAPFGVRVNSVSPGYIRTDMTAMSWNDEELRAKRAASSMLGRWGETRDVALACRFLLSDDSQFVTGADIPVDGGWLAKG